MNELVRARLYLKIPSTARRRMHDGVAIRLLAAGAVGESIPGLEIAWHCIRARRREQATPFLMSGARGAILHGAPDEAARALSSALGQLKGTTRDEAALLLAEAYQEMGDWKGALECVEGLSVDHKTDPNLAQVAFVLGVQSRNELGEFSPDQQLAVSKELVARASNPVTHPGTRVRAALTAALISARTRSPHMLATLRKMLETFPADRLDERSQTRLLLAKGYTSYHSRGLGEGRNQTLAGAQLLEAAGAADTTYVRIQIGLGAFACVSGNYAEGVHHLERAYNAAARLDHVLLITNAVTNLALCSYRLGLLDKQLHWASLATTYSARLDAGSYDRALSSYLDSVGKVLSGFPKDAMASLETLREVKECAQAIWIQEAVILFEADIVWLMGHKKAAIDMVRRSWVIGSDQPTLGFEGRYARWKTLSLVQDERIDEASELLRSLHAELGRFDAIDQAEILCCLAHLGRTTGRVDFEISDRVRTALARLPIACSDHLVKLGLLLPD